MTTRSIGELEVSVAGLGCNNFGGRIDAAASQAVVDAALDAGVTHFDTADLYGGGKSEEFLGQVLAGRQRDSYVLATKVFFPMPDGGRGRSRTACAGWAPTTSTCTGCTSPTRPPRSVTPSPPSTA